MTSHHDIKWCHIVNLSKTHFFQDIFFHFFFRPPENTYGHCRQTQGQCWFSTLGCRHRREWQFMFYPHHSRCFTINLIQVWRGLFCTLSTPTEFAVLADVDISPNPNTFNFWTAEYEYIKKTGIRIDFFFKIEGIREFIWSESIWIHLSESEYISFFTIEYEYAYPVRDMDLSPCSVLARHTSMRLFDALSPIFDHFRRPFWAKKTTKLC